LWWPVAVGVVETAVVAVARVDSVQERACLLPLEPITRLRLALAEQVQRLLILRQGQIRFLAPSPAQAVGEAETVLAAAQQEQAAMAALAAAHNKTIKQAGLGIHLLYLRLKEAMAGIQPLAQIVAVAAVVVRQQPERMLQILRKLLVLVALVLHRLSLAAP